MTQDFHAARQGDAILHPPLIAELASALGEAVVYAASTAMLAAAIAGTAVAVVGTGGAAAFLIPLMAGALVGSASQIPVAEGQSVGAAITDLCDSVANALFPAEPFGVITTGSPDTRINGKPAARAAGRRSGPASAADADGAEPGFLGAVGAIAQSAAPMLLPVLGLGMEIYNIFNPPVTTPADPGTQPGDHDEVSCSRHPPAPITYIAQGSSKVFINGQPAARAGDKTTCDARLASQVSPNVRIGGEAITVRDVRNGKSRLAQFTGLVSGMLISRRVRPRPGPRNAPGASGHIRGCKGNPVFVSTGSKVLGGALEHDFTLPGLVPIEWTRSYDSQDLRRDGLLGQGWSVPCEVEIVRVPHPQGGELWVYVDEEGSRLELGRLKAGDAFVSVLDGLAFFALDDGLTVVEDIYAGRYQVFQSDPHTAQRSRLIRVGDRNRNAFELLYLDDGRLGYLCDAFSLTLVALHYDARHPRRVARLERLYIKPGTAPGTPREYERRETLCSYRYSAAGQLQEVLDASGAVIRRFSYSDAGLLLSHTLASGAVRHYQWQRFAVPAERPRAPDDDGQRHALPPVLEAQPEHEWRVVRHHGSDGEDYRFDYDLEQGRTRVTDSLGRVDHYWWGAHYEIYRHVDALGQTWQDRILAGQLRQSIDPQGGAWHYQYDELGRLIESRDPLGRRQHLTYTRHWALPLTITDGPRSRRLGYDAQGNLLWEQDALGHRTTYRHDAQGRLEKRTDALGKSQYLRWNPHGQLISHRDCSNKEWLYRYHPDGQLGIVINPRGEQTRHRYDARGYRVESERPDGRREHYHIDRAGQLTRYTDPSGRHLALEYDRSGRLTRRTDARGYSVAWRYDAYGRLVQLSNENQEAYHFSWDMLDRLLTETGLDGGAKVHAYSALGDVVRLTWQPAPAQAGEPATPALVHDFERDAMGRLLRKRTDDGITDYAHDEADNLLSIVFTSRAGHAQRLDYEYDLLGRLLGESTSAGRLHYRHDPLGNLETLTLADGRQLNHLYYGSGHLHQINLDGRVISDFERDALHEEVQRSQGALHTRTCYDSNGRLAGKALHYHDASRASSALLDKRYHYDAGDCLIREQLTQTQRSGHGPGMPGGDTVLGRFHSDNLDNRSLEQRILYSYDNADQLCGRYLFTAQRRDPHSEIYNYDKAGNALEPGNFHAAVAHNQQREHRDKRYRYDGFGRLIEVAEHGRVLQRFAYDAEHRLVTVHLCQFNHLQRVEFAYDPLGRRLSKHLYEGDRDDHSSRTFFHWQGLRLLGEVQHGQPSLYVYASPDSYEPLARMDGRPGQEAIFYFHTNVAGRPEQLTDEDGHTVWHSDHEAWGKSREEWRHWRHVPEQNLRFQGQYLDRETGLHYNTFRYFDPQVGRFTQPDPIGLAGGINLYRYAPNPVLWVDPWGWTPCEPNKKTSYEAVSRRDAFRQAKRDADIPMSSQPRVHHSDLLDGNKHIILNRNGTLTKTRNYYYTNRNGQAVVIQEHSHGHTKAVAGRGLEPHFNVRDIENLKTGSFQGTHGHYNFTE